jgi:hypothetical protein
MPRRCGGDHRWWVAMGLLQSQRGARNIRAVHLADHPRLGGLSAAVFVVWREAASTVEAVGAIAAA